MGARHLLWIPAAAAVGFLAAFIFGDQLTLPVDLYYLVYFAIVIGFFAAYARTTGLDLGPWVRQRLPWAIGLGLLFGLIMLRQVLSRPATEHLGGAVLVWAIAWRGLVYGGVDGLLLFAFPWIVTWRAFGGGRVSRPSRLFAAIVAWAMVLFVTTAYHLGYRDFRSDRIVQPNIGSAITALPTLVTANPVASPIAHVMLHVGAVVHSPYTELFLPPHRSRPGAATAHEPVPPPPVGVQVELVKYGNVR